ncbi:hypothetical protein BCAT_0337 [Bifidobacterium catenulatum DSM 16992 = JCM 1194 = LMG 11043]|nr:hypothetical protein BCAT_0337 [Bifidobacterium catenulatum DSM 16992 = JCM 1194 = LMG 11043]
MLPIYPRNDRKTSEIRRNGGASDFLSSTLTSDAIYPLASEGCLLNGEHPAFYSFAVSLVVWHGPHVCLVRVFLLEMRLRLLCAMSP